MVTSPFIDPRLFQIAHACSISTTSSVSAVTGEEKQPRPIDASGLASGASALVDASDPGFRELAPPPPRPRSEHEKHRRNATNNKLRITGKLVLLGELATLAFGLKIGFFEGLARADLNDRCPRLEQNWKQSSINVLRAAGVTGLRNNDVLSH